MSVRVFIPPGSAGEVTLDAEESHYLVRVRRGRAGQEIEALDGASGRWHATVRAADPRAARIALGPAIPTPAVAERAVLLGMPDRAPMLEALDHALCLGASAVLLVRCARGADALPGRARLDRTLRAAMRQCGRPKPVPLLGPYPLAEALDMAPGRRFVATPGGTQLIHPSFSPASVLVGPEGGLTPQELILAREHGFAAMDLGPWILRTPLALAAALSRLVPCAADAGA